MELICPKFILMSATVIVVEKKLNTIRLGGRPSLHSDGRYGDRGHDSDQTRGILRWIGIEPMISPRSTEQRLWTHPLTCERTIHWFKGLRRMRKRYDPLLFSKDTWTTLAAAAI